MEPARADSGDGCAELVGVEQEERLLGTWTYPGKRGPTQYSVRRAPDGCLLFDGPDGKGLRLLGALRPHGRWVQAELARKGGAAAGAIRLAPLDGRLAVVSNFRAAGKVKWGKDIVAQHLDEAQAKLASSERGPFSVYSGCISRGDDLLVAEMTVGEAKVRCRNLERCQGFCFRGTGEDVDPVVQVFFKSKWDLVARPSDGGAWTAFRYEEARAPQAEAAEAAPAEQPWEEEPGDDLNVIPGKRCFWDNETLRHASAPKPRLSGVAVELYRENGFLGPMRALTVEEIRECQEGLGRFVSGHCQGIMDNTNCLFNHVTLPWLYKLACHPRIVGAVASALKTEDVMLFSSCMFLRSPGLSCQQEHGVGWHQDGVLYEKVLDPMEDWITAFVALSPCRVANGCLQYVPRRMVRGPATEDRKFPYMELGPGEFSMHSSKVTHRAGTNVTASRRDCLAFRYISGRVRDTVADLRSDSARDSVIVCSGQPSRHFAPLPPPAAELGEAELAKRAEIAALRASRYGTTRFQ